MQSIAGRVILKMTILLVLMTLSKSSPPTKERKAQGTQTKDSPSPIRAQNNIRLRITVIGPHSVRVTEPC